MIQYAVLMTRVGPPKSIYRLRRERRLIVFTSAFIADPTGTDAIHLDPLSGVKCFIRVQTPNTYGLKSAGDRHP